ncbi:hypothetical protein [Cellulomonas bogoriensis]|nr:hypothetical protein [Cellulomonas bogoriensis]
MTIDQRASRRRGDQVDRLLGWAGARLSAGAPGIVRGIERTVGDEVQVVLNDSAAVVDTALRVLRLSGWSVGIGIGPVDLPLPAETRAGSGIAFLHARDAVERAKSRARPAPLAVSTTVPELADDCESVLTLLATVISRRTPAGWAVIDELHRVDVPTTQDAVAGRLGITQQAVSQRLRAAAWAEELAVRPTLARLLDAADESAHATGRH